jgi:hypothetical protein
LQLFESIFGHGGARRNVGAMKYHGPRHDLANLHQIKAREFFPLGQSQHGTCPLSCRVGVSAVIEVVSF